MKSESVVILTGAGISAESGIQTFRGVSGLWENHRIEEVATPQAFENNPSMVLRFYNERRRTLLSPDTRPNPAHCALGLLERKSPNLVTIVTQNVDNLHERGGNERVIHIHGELLKGFCCFCRMGFDIHNDLNVTDVCENCNRSGGLRPDIVWFGEMPYRMDDINSLLQDCGLFIAIGTSGNVYPAAGFVDIARRFGARTLEVNLEPSLAENRFEIHHYGKAGEVVPELVDKILLGDFRGL